MNKIIGGELGVNENGERKNFNFYIKQFFSLTGISRINGPILTENIKFVSILALLDYNVDDFVSQLSEHGYYHISTFSEDSEDLYLFIENNKDKISSGELLVGFLYDGLTIKSIVFAEKNKSDEEIRFNIDNTRNELVKCLEQEKI